MGKQIQWFPGHMVKALKEIKNQLQTVDVVIVLADARAPLSSLNPELFSLIKDKPRIMILSKKDLADQNQTKKWIEHFNNLGYITKDFNLNKDKINSAVLNLIAESTKEKREKKLARGFKTFCVRAMVVGIPNVGKSTFINQMVKRKASKVGNMPGVTRAQQLIRVNEQCELLDTPGVLWPKFEDPQVGIKLALIGTIKSEILPNNELIDELFAFMANSNYNGLKKRYGIDITLPVNIPHVIDDIGRQRGMLKTQNEVDYERVEALLLKEFKDGLLGPYTLETV